MRDVVKAVVEILAKRVRHDVHERHRLQLRRAGVVIDVFVPRRK